MRQDIQEVFCSHFFYFSLFQGAKGRNENPQSPDSKSTLLNSTPPESMILDVPLPGPITEVPVTHGLTASNECEIINGKNVSSPVPQSRERKEAHFKPGMNRMDISVKKGGICADS